MKYLALTIFCLVGAVLCIENNFKGFDDTIIFGLNWPGAPEVLETLADGEANKSKTQNKEVLKVTTSNKEKYECLLPELQTKESSSIEEYDGPSPINLLKPLFSQKICSYRLESYWSYEVCHGRYIRQYHEERDGKQVKTQEYYLGHWSPEKQLKLEADLQAAQENKEKPKTTKVEGLSLPFIGMAMDDGTICDLSGKPRLTRVLYVCYAHGKHEVYSFKETATCEYEIIILSPLLCEHPQFKPKDVSENIIDCIPIGDSPKKPRSLLQMEVESLRFHHQTIKFLSNVINGDSPLLQSSVRGQNVRGSRHSPGITLSTWNYPRHKPSNLVGEFKGKDKEAKDVLAVLKVEKIEQDGETHLKFELHPVNEDEALVEEPSKLPQLADKPAALRDDSPVRAFLNGENCLNGGTGWWKYEFCYGRHVVQYHVDRIGEKTTLMLGRFDEQAHLDWVKENKGKAPKPVDQRTSVSHFYSNGDICDKTGKPRQTEVKLKCFENSSSPAQVSLYLLEPRTCHYILGVESPLICDILPLADENGLIKSPQLKLLKQEALVEREADQVDEDDSDTKLIDVPKIGDD